jgi:hypothetical protein
MVARYDLLTQRNNLRTENADHSRSPDHCPHLGMYMTVIDISGLFLLFHTVRKRSGRIMIPLHSKDRFIELLIDFIVYMKRNVATGQDKIDIPPLTLFESLTASFPN